MKNDHSSDDNQSLLLNTSKLGRLLAFINAKKDNYTLLVLTMSAVVGVLSGFVGVGFEKAVTLVQSYRMSFIMMYGYHHWLLMIPLAFVFSAILAVIGYFLVRVFAPEAGGSGIPEIEGGLDELRPVRWWRVIPVKFIGGMGTLGAGMVLGREGPTVQLCGNIGRMVSDLFRLKSRDGQHTLLSTGAAAGLSAAFNAPLAGILFIIEEMRPQFRYNLLSIKAIFIGVSASCIVYRIFNGDAAVIHVDKLVNAPINTLWLYLVLGIIFGIIGVGFNRLIFTVQDVFQCLHGGNINKFLLIGAILGGICGVLSIIEPAAAGGGFKLIPLVIAGHYTVIGLLAIFIIRIITTILCFCSGAPGGIFAPMLALGTLFGTVFGLVASHFFPQYHLVEGTFAIAGMGALFAASVRAPLTGIVLVLEMTDNYQLILPMIITCLGATLLAQLLGGRPLYSVLLERTLKRQALLQQQAKSAEEGGSS